MEAELDELNRLIGRLKQSIKHRDEWTDALCDALQPLLRIFEAYHTNNLDDEARRFWGENDENENQTPPEEIILLTGRGGKTLLTLMDCIVAKEAIDYF